jgi:phenylpropionate dioxygenase-like ring-hydroxylating dioxygenase large terminal subunit
MINVKKTIFNTQLNLTEGWYWLCSSAELKKGKVKAITFADIELAIYRGENGKVVALHAYCPHMGAHFAEGRVEKNQLRCFFHNWRFDEKGNCTDIPCLKKMPATNISVKSYHVVEQHKMIWVWLGKDEPLHPVPEVPELANQKTVVALGNRFYKNCHPNVVMINAIDEQHFHTVHQLPGSILQMEPDIINQHNIAFRNKGCMPNTHWIGKLLSRFYKGALTYEMSYWYGHVGTTTFGPDFLHFHLMFALRQTADGKTEGQTIAFTRYRKGLLGGMLSKMILCLTKIAGCYFAKGDTQIFQTIQFNLKNPLAADRAIIHFKNHLEQQEPYERLSTE